MRNRMLRGVIALGTVVIAALIVLQVYWFKKAFDVAEKQFDHTVQVALMRVADSVSAGAEVKKLSSNFFFVATECPLQEASLQHSLDDELSKRNLHVDYELAVYRADDDTLVYGQYIEATKKQRIEYRDVNQASQKNFAVYFPKKESHVIAQLDVWIMSTVVLLLVTGFFAYALLTLLREKKFSELKTDFVNNMTHEFKTPVTNIGITGEIIRRKIPQNSGVEVYLDILMKENDKLRRKIDEVLLGASVDHLKKPAFEHLDIHEIIHGCAEAFRLKVEERQGKMQLAFQATSTFILGDRELLTQAINNVIDNAEKYSVSKPQITVKTRDHRRGIEIDIVDNGVGIPAAMRAKVFEKFFRLQQRKMPAVKGFGLGLNFVKNVIRSHRGRILLMSDLDKGTEVRIILPKA